MPDLVKVNSKPMVFVMDKFNKGHYMHYTGDMNKGTFSVQGEDYGKHLFKTLTVQAEDEDTFKNIAPLGTVLPDYSYENRYLSEIECFFEPQSVAGVVIDKLQAELTELQGSVKRIEARRVAKLKQHDKYLDKLSDQNDKELERNRKLREEVKRLEGETYSLGRKVMSRNDDVANLEIKLDKSEKAGSYYVKGLLFTILVLIVTLLATFQ